MPPVHTSHRVHVLTGEFRKSCRWKVFQRRVTLFSPENDGGKRSSVNVFRWRFYCDSPVVLMRIDGEGMEYERRKGCKEGGRRRAQKSLVNSTLLQLIFQTTSSLISLIATFSALRSAADLLFISSWREQAWLSITAWFISADVNRI